MSAFRRRASYRGRWLCGLLLAAFLLTPLAGCDSGGIKEGIDKDAAKAPPPPFPGMDAMKAKMEKGKK